MLDCVRYEDSESYNQLSNLARGVPKQFTKAELDRRTKRIKEAQKLRWRRPVRWKLELRNSKTGETKRALAKHAEMLSDREAKAIVKRTKGKMGDWEYVAVPVLWEG